MRRLPPFSHCLRLVLGVSLLLAGCTYDAAVRQLSRPERAEFFTYRKLMTSSQVRTYLAQASMTERTAYLSEIGLAQRFQALEPGDRETIRAGFPKPGMSAEALRFLWGEPYDTAGEAERYAHWFYLGSSMALAEAGNDYQTPGNRVDVYIVEGKVVGWVDYTPSAPTRKRRHIL